MFKLSKIRYALVAILLLFQQANAYCQFESQVFFEDYGIHLDSIKTVGDTIVLQEHSDEEYHFVFYDYIGNCYCERYIGGLLVEKGVFYSRKKTYRMTATCSCPTLTKEEKKKIKYFKPQKNGKWYYYGKDRQEWSRKYYRGFMQS